MLLLAGRVGQLLNLTDISNALGVDAKTIEAWVSVLETSFIAFRLQPYFENISKRVVKTPKIYFYDTGVVCNLLGIKTVKELENSPQWGGIFENFVITEMSKQTMNRGLRPHIYFMRDKMGNEVDLIEKVDTRLILSELKSARTFTSDFEKGLKSMDTLLDKVTTKRIVYRGPTQERRSVKLINVEELLTNKLS
jgi:predicted AAA+ superfamily ATPase